MIFDKACAKRRKVSCCGSCCRFENCRDKKPVDFVNYDGCLQLGYAIIGDVCVKYEKAYQQGKRNLCKYYKNWLCSTRTTLLSAENYDGQALYDALERKCIKAYGTLDSIYKKKCNVIEGKIAEIKKQIKLTVDVKEKQKLQNKISKLRGELNE